MDIVNIPVAIVINAWYSIEFSEVDPHIGRKIFMFVINAFIHYVNNNIRHTGIYFPGRFQINISSGITAFLAGIVVMPLQPVVGIIYWWRAGSGIQRF